MIDIILQISLILVIAFVVSLVVRLLKQPLVIGYILTGIILSLLGMLSYTSEISTFAEMGIVILLFMVGLHLNPRVIKEVGKVSLISALGQFVLTFIPSFFILKYFGFSSIASGYVALALTFSSTIIITKLLSDKGELETLYGKISVGFLIVQDLIAILFLIVISSLSSNISLTSLVFASVFKGLALLVALFFVSIYILPSLTRYTAKSQEFLFLFSIGWCFLLAMLFYQLGFSMEIGALLAGITLSMSPYHYEINSKMKPLRDFFILLFFIWLGSQVSFASIFSYLPLIILLSLFILVGTPIIMLVIMGLLGYTKRTSFLVGLSVAQISEFSLILIALGVKISHISSSILSLVTIIGIITIVGSTYFMLYSNKLYSIFSRYLSFFERKGKKIDEYGYSRGDHEIMLLGYNRIGFSLLKSLEKISKKYIIVDFNPETIKKLSEKKLNCIYGDADDTEFLEGLHIHKAELIISTIPDFETNSIVLNSARKSKKTIIILTAHQVSDALRLYIQGADYVIMPHFLGGESTSALIENFKTNKKLYEKERKKQIHHLMERIEQKHEHPKVEKHG